MRTISIREFNRNFYRELQDLPFIVSKRENNKKGHPVESSFIVIAYRPDLIISAEASDIDLAKRPPEKKGFLGLFKK